MASLPVVYPPPAWANQNIILYHGTTDPLATAILTGGIAVSTGRPGTDFGPGFYTTTLYRQAHMWAVQIAKTKTPIAPLL